ncbi:26S proteasome regulatory complex [Volvox carteri f. nagariensis]|uniref:26S proteasome non-ATPase regulatory subunit 1 homolog n=1 Tax=Volvox carteri f. nagariensis TaxID=3068 RepID=D8TYP3_VOLCA|nr:26S proteasome regulatory complex [Volvox carteri f. nagariensis]EFJ47427.1 26S proteasome regulatory complex [Volvox carteri f. nagariensis]|eukprot:XP_002951616.1 26S proteasome regulatory complex [Volvox carteri f. nagariensis]
MPAVSSAAGLLALLDEPSDDLKQHALSHLNKVVHDYWFQISGSIGSVEALYEDDDFAHRELAALVASKVFYHLGELDDALTYALGAGSLFDVEDQSEYVTTLVARCLDQYFEKRVRQSEGRGEESETVIDSRLTAIVERMLDKCLSAGQYDQAIGVALEGRRLDKLEEVILRAPAGEERTRVLKYALRVCQQLIVSREFRQQVLRLVIRLYESVPSPDWLDICQCLMFLDDAPEVARILNKLLQGGEEEELLAYQIGFDLVENELQSFLGEVAARLEQQQQIAAPEAVDAAPEAAAMDTDAPAGAAAAAGGGGGPLAARVAKLRDILSGKTPIALYLDFLYRHNHADLQVLKNIKGAVDARVSVCHSATIAANALMHAGSTVDTFLRTNLEWLARATNWAKFSATASLGVIHRGHLAQGRALMAPYLPRGDAAAAAAAAAGGGGGGTSYSEGGALYALGLIYANHGQDIRQFLLESLRGTSNEVTQHGACLGLGLAALGTDDEEALEDIKNVLYSDSAVAGEAAGISLGLLCCGSGGERVAAEALAYAHDTQHEKIIRGVALGLALMQYGREEAAEALIEQMTRDADPIIRYGGMYVIGMAYRGTDNNGAVQKLLSFAVSDVSDDVRRAAVLCLGFVLMNVPHQCPRIVALLAESFNPHVRYGAAMAVGLACGGTGLKEALALLEPMMSDPTDYVRQGALIAIALVLIQQPESRVAPFRKRLDKFITEKHEEVMCKMGAIIAAGILDGGGRNTTIGLRSRSGYFRRTSVVGLAVFTQYWYWYPLLYFLSLAFQPSVLIALNSDLKMPKAAFTCNCKPSIFAYPPPLTAELKETKSKVPTAVLSTTAKAAERQRKKAAEKEKAAAGADKMETDEAGAAGGAKKPEAEPSSYTLENPARVPPGQARFVVLPTSGRWLPVKRESPVGILVMRDTQPGEPQELVTAQGDGAAAAAATAPAAAATAPAAAAPAAGDMDDEPPPPAPFTYQP